MVNVFANAGYRQIIVCVHSKNKRGFFHHGHFVYASSSLLLLLFLIFFSLSEKIDLAIKLDILSTKQKKKKELRFSPFYHFEINEAFYLTGNFYRMNELSSKLFHVCYPRTHTQYQTYFSTNISSILHDICFAEVISLEVKYL